MQFNSYVFILIFLPVVVIGYFIFNKINFNVGKVFLIVMSTLFYIYGGIRVAILLGISIIINFLLSFIINKLKNKVILTVAIVVNIGLLFYYKYFNFFLSNAYNLFDKDFTARKIILPLGISFFTFQQIMYIVNVYKDEIKKVDIWDYLLYILYFPKLLMGPLVEPNELISQFNNEKIKSVNWDNISYGIKIFSFGLFKKVVLADTFAIAVSWGYNNIAATTAMDWFLVVLFYTFEIYFDFSGYSDMAVGVSKMMNITLPINFDSPYMAISIRDFWKRWHMSLTNFFTKYIYIPLGGSKKGKIRTYVNILIVFIVSGIWHGANWTFILWGLIHGALSVAERIIEKNKYYIIEAVRWIGTFFVINILWLLFRSSSIEQWKEILIRMFTFTNMNISGGLINCFILPETSFVLSVLRLTSLNQLVTGLSLLLFTFISFFICLVPKNNYRQLEKNNCFTMMLSATAFIWSFLCLSSETIFVYNNF